MAIKSSLRAPRAIRALAVIALVFIATNVVALVAWYDLSSPAAAVAPGVAAPPRAHRSLAPDQRRFPAGQALRATQGAPAAPTRPRCELSSEESEGPWLDFVVPLRNRAARLVDIAYNMGELWRDGGDRRFRVLFADLGSTDANLTDLVARLSRKTCVPMWDPSVGFSRAHALRAGLNEVYRRWPDDMVFCLDADMQLPAEFMMDARRYVVRGASFWAPVAFGTYENKPIELAPGNGRWRTMYKGDLGFFASDAVKINLFINEQISMRWGSEDDKAFYALAKSGLEVHRYNMTGFFHVWHQVAPWKSSRDGITKELPPPPPAPVPAEPPAPPATDTVAATQPPPEPEQTEPQQQQDPVLLPQQQQQERQEAPEAPKCELGREESEGPWVNLVVPLYNRAHSLEGLLRGIDELWSTGGDRRMRVVVADQGSTDADVPALVARLTERSCVAVSVVAVAKPEGRAFSRAGALRAALESVREQHPDDIVFCLNVDMRLPRTFMQEARANIERGKSVWVPIAFGLFEDMPLEAVRGNGKWRRHSKGDIGIFVDDAVKLKLWADEQQYTWGDEDDRTFFALEQSQLTINQAKLEGFFHLWHPKSSWRDEAPRPVKVDMTTKPTYNVKVYDELPKECELTAEESAGAWLDFIVPVRNRAKRLAEVARNVGEVRREGGDKRVRLVVADQNSTDADVGEVLRGLARETCVPAVLVEVAPGVVGFSRGGTLRAGILEVYRRWPGDLVFTLDTDMVLPAKTFTREAREHTVRGVSFWTPISFATYKGRPAVVAPENGKWKVYGKGDLGLYAEDAVRVDLFAVDEKKYTWGGEDDRSFAALIAAGYTVHRYNLTGYFHLWHPKIQWQSSKDGITRDLPASCATTEQQRAGTWLTFLVPHRNRPDRLTSLLYAVGDIWRLTPDKRLRVVVADQSTPNISALVAAVSKDTCIDMRVVPVPEPPDGAGFSRAAALRAALLDVAARHPDDMVFTLNVDMILPTFTFMPEARDHIVRGVSFWAPVPFSTYEWKPAEIDKANGRWDLYSRADIGIFVEDAIKLKLYEAEQKLKWGGEDDRTWFALTKSGLTAHRYNLTGFFHQWHPKIAWKSSTDGITKPKAVVTKVVKHEVIVYVPQPNDCASVAKDELEGPWLTFIVPLRNRANRLASLLWNIGDMWRVGGDKRMRVIVADQGSTDSDISAIVKRASSETCVDMQVISVAPPKPGVGFSRAGALHAGLSEVYSKHPEDAVFLLDVDMKLPEETFMSEARKNIVRGVSAWSPIAFGLGQGRPAEIAPANGKWRMYDKGDIGIYATDAKRMDLLVAEQVNMKYGKENDKMAAALKLSSLAQYDRPIPLSPGALMEGLPEKCQMSKEEMEGPWVDFIIALRNRSPRLVKLAENIARLRQRDKRIRIVVSDNNSTDADVPALVKKLSAETCVPMWHILVPTVGAGFAKAAALHAAIQDIHHKFPEDIAFTVDADMLLPDNFVEHARRYIVRGREFWAPICFGTFEGKPIEVGPDNGIWRVLGTGNMGYFVSDAITMRLYAEHVKKTTHGWEDVRAYNLLSKDGLRLRVNRDNMEGFFHLWHPKAAWEGSKDGMGAAIE
eukprot:m51a1_g4610 hypothetical protein (1588) ;mRNA; r:252271-257814